MSPPDAGPNQLRAGPELHRPDEKKNNNNNNRGGGGGPRKLPGDSLLVDTDLSGSTLKSTAARSFLRSLASRIQDSNTSADEGQLVRVDPAVQVTTTTTHTQSVVRQSRDHSHHHHYRHRVDDDEEKALAIVNTTPHNVDIITPYRTRSDEKSVVDITAAVAPLSVRKVPSSGVPDTTPRVAQEIITTFHHPHHRTNEEDGLDRELRNSGGGSPTGFFHRDMPYYDGGGSLSATMSTTTPPTGGTTIDPSARRFPLHPSRDTHHHRRLRPSTTTTPPQTAQHTRPTTTTSSGTQTTAKAGTSTFPWVEDAASPAPSSRGDEEAIGVALTGMGTIARARERAMAAVAGRGSGEQGEGRGEKRRRVGVVDSCQRRETGFGVEDVRGLDAGLGGWVGAAQGRAQIQPQTHTQTQAQTHTHTYGGGRERQAGVERSSRQVRADQARVDQARVDQARMDHTRTARQARRTDAGREIRQTTVSSRVEEAAGEEMVPRLPPSSPQVVNDDSRAEVSSVRRGEGMSWLRLSMDGSRF